jgi:hypothetical protein
LKSKFIPKGFSSHFNTLLHHSCNAAAEYQANIGAVLAIFSIVHVALSIVSQIVHHHDFAATFTIYRSIKIVAKYIINPENIFLLTLQTSLNKESFIVILLIH